VRAGIERKDIELRVAPERAGQQFGVNRGTIGDQDADAADWDGRSKLSLPIANWRVVNLIMLNLIMLNLIMANWIGAEASIPHNVFLPLKIDTRNRLGYRRKQILSSLIPEVQVYVWSRREMLQESGIPIMQETASSVAGGCSPLRPPFVP
jgi:hypothetical protein